jgi:ADP-ribose pyrophosphatase YjhB (NUDIX family)
MKKIFIILFKKEGHHFEILMVKEQKTNQKTPPSGFQEDGESCEAAAVRILEQTTGILLDIASNSEVKKIDISKEEKTLVGLDLLGEVVLFHYHTPRGLRAKTGEWSRIDINTKGVYVNVVEMVQLAKDQHYGK